MTPILGTSKNHAGLQRISNAARVGQHYNEAQPERSRGLLLIHSVILSAKTANDKLTISRQTRIWPTEW